MRISVSNTLPINSVTLKVSIKFGMFIHELFIPGKDYEVVGLDSGDCEEGDEYLTASFVNYLSSSLCHLHLDEHNKNQYRCVRE